MDNNRLASNIIESLAWPVTALIVLAILRKVLSSAKDLSETFRTIV